MRNDDEFAKDSIVISGASSDQFPYAGEMVVVVFGDKVEMVDQTHGRLQARVEKGVSEHG